MKTERRDYGRIVEDNSALVRMLAKRFVGRGIEYDDIYQAGCLGLYKAAVRYDEKYNTAFSTYAVPVIIGEMRMLFRSGGPVKVGRGIKVLNACALAACERLRESLGREPHLSEVASELGETPERIAEALTACAPPVSIEDDSYFCGASAQDETELLLSRVDMKNALSRLSEEERRLIFLRYEHELSQAKTGEVLGVSQVQVSRREKSILEKLRVMLV